ncbi:ankyrin repeat domain-containing protein [Zhongshania sp.]|uniref:ankyrin repeat domain-containing protein n=1 Tax=Zhongshania sp. TaxID=1971902 RepID=UPI00356B57B2
MGWFTNKALFGGIKNRDYETVQLALSKGADPNSYHYGITPLMRACMADDSVIIRMLIDAGADPHKKDKSGSYDTYEFCRDNGWEGAIKHIENLASMRDMYKEAGIDPSNLR